MPNICEKFWIGLKANIFITAVNMEFSECASGISLAL